MTTNQPQVVLTVPKNFSFIDEEARKKLHEQRTQRVLEIQAKLQAKLEAITNKNGSKPEILEAMAKIDFKTIVETINKAPEPILIETKPLEKKREIPANVKTIYIDANTLLFMNNDLRQYSISRNKADAENLLYKGFNAYLEACKDYNLVVVFNQLKTTGLENKEGLELKQAAPEFTNAGDAFVEWAKNKSIDVQSSLFVSSAKDIQTRLSEVSGEASINVMRPVRWLRLMLATIGKEFSAL